MNDLEQLSDRLHELAGTPASAAPTQHLLERGRRAKHRRAALTSTSLAVLALGAVTAVAVANYAPKPVDRPSASATLADTRTQLAAAITASQSTSYRLSLADNFAPAWTGAFDPTTKTGVLHQPFDEGPGFSEQRLVNGVLYYGSAGVDRVLHWDRVPGTHDGFSYDSRVGDTLTSYSDPAELQAALTHDGVTITQTDAKTFHFEYSPKLDQWRTSDHYSGDITLDGAGRIAKVAYERVVDWTKPGGHDYPPVHIKVTEEFSDYGVPVQVEAPKLG